MNEQIKSDWDYLYNSTEIVLRDSPPPIFSPTNALAYALCLADSTDEEQATHCRQLHPEGIKSFYAAARFALPFLLSEKSEFAQTPKIQPVPLSTLAAGVAKFLQSLQSQYGQTIYEQTEWP